LRKPATGRVPNVRDVRRPLFACVPIPKRQPNASAAKQKKDFGVSNLFVIRPYPNAKDGAFPILTRHRFKKNLIRAQSAH
jgi:hypothetical protein